MGYYGKNPNTYTKENFFEIPQGNHRVKISKVRVERFNNKEGNEKHCYEITLKVSGCPGKLWYYLWYHAGHLERSTREFEKFYDSFQIEDRDRAHYKDWVGKSGAVKVGHFYQWKCYTTEVVSCLDREVVDKLPPWSDELDEKYSILDVKDYF